MVIIFCSKFTLASESISLIFVVFNCFEQDVLPLL